MSGWSLRRLDQLADVSAGNPAPQGDLNFSGGTLPFFRTSDVGRIHLGDLSEAENWVNELGAKGMRLHPAGTVLIPKSGASTFTDHRVITTRPGYVSSHLATIKADGRNACDRYLYYALQTISARDVAGDSSYPTLSLAQVKAIEIPAPPLAEQQRIVAILDEAFEGIDAAAVNATITKALAGDLLFSAGELLLSLHNADADHITLEAALEKGWITSHLDGNHGSFYPRAEEFVEAGVPYISANCIVSDQIDLTRAKYLTPERAATIKKGIARNGDVIFAHNATVGPVAILRTAQSKVILSTSVTYYRCNPSQVKSEYLKHFMRSRRFVSQYEAVMRQSTRNQVPITTQRRFVFTFPPINAQEAIAATLEAVEREAEKISDLASRKLSALSELKQSLLARAFSGELTAKIEQVANDSDFATPELAANILAFMHWRHERANRGRFFGHVMGQKTLDLVERVGCVELGRSPYKDAAGPNDRAHMVAAERWAKQQGFFEFIERSGGGYDFKKLSNHSVMLAAAKTALKPVEVQLARVTDILVGKDKVEAEVFDTVLAAWNNLVAEGAEASDVAIIYEARENWHPDKLAIPISIFHSAIQEIRQRGLVPDGTAKVVHHRQASALMQTAGTPRVEGQLPQTAAPSE